MNASTTRTAPDGSVTVTLPVDVSSEDWLTAADGIRVAYPGRFVQWFLDTEGRDAFEVAAAADEVQRLCSLCEAGQPHGHGHGHGHGTGSWV